MYTFVYSVRIVSYSFLFMSRCNSCIDKMLCYCVQIVDGSQLSLTFVIVVSYPIVIAALLIRTDIWQYWLFSDGSRLSASQLMLYGAPNWNGF